MYMKPLLLLALVPFCSGQWYPLTTKEEIPVDIKPYEKGQDVVLHCISRNIDDGEHKFDDQQRIMTIPFPTCKETGKPLGFHYGVDEDIKCTIGFSDELFHMFQLYVHEDAPFSCRMPLSSEDQYLQKGGAYVPLTFNFRGEVHDSHLDLDTSLNVLMTAPSSNELKTFVSAVAWSSGTDTQRVTIGSYVTLDLAVRWLNLITPLSSTTYEEALPYANGFYRFPTVVSTSTLYNYVSVAVVATSVVISAIAFRFRRSRKIRDSEYIVDTKND